LSLLQVLRHRDGGSLRVASGYRGGDLAVLDLVAPWVVGHTKEVSPAVQLGARYEEAPEEATVTGRFGDREMELGIARTEGLCILARGQRFDGGEQPSA
jgi:hypothetical protein